MRIIVFFDLPVTTSRHRRNYQKFRKFLLRSGYYQLQESVYVRLLLNQTAANTAVKNLYKHRPPEGLVQALTVTEKQFSRMESIVGTSETDQLVTDERTVIL